MWIVLIGWLLFALGPYIWMFLTSIKPTSELFARPMHYLPQHGTLAAYRELISTTPFLEFMEHSLLVAAFTAMFTLLLATPAGFSLSRHTFKGKKVVLSLLISSQFFPSILLVLALYPIMRSTGLIHTMSGLIVVYTAFVTPFTTWLMKGFFDGIPKDVDEAAKVDGCSEFEVIWYVLLPVLVPGLVAAGAYIVIFSWNEFLFALTFASNTGASTLPVGLNTFIGDYITRWDLLTAGGVVSAIPIVIFFMLIQKRLISGLTAGAVKS
ncbi:Binding-protein-dependent transport system inner membrane component [Acididesulfobacillus acetoxydans]|uniref:ABC transporter, permease protein n=2 Tax=Acididesulfobacillus acetoxydans TaxID=1561005 RepID=A0A8S0VYP5_9FIRM|nr:Binding-protein-dependent transport system inner membrane component [Acididesulfobacillus acetoxydans]CEJ06032.1 ABC transporter, permease protein [Acididesulfobacillus acetoxydans]